MATAQPLLVLLPRCGGLVDRRHGHRTTTLCRQICRDAGAACVVGRLPTGPRAQGARRLSTTRHAGVRVGSSTMRVNWAPTPAAVAVGGDSAGGNLAALVSLRARDEGVTAARAAAAALPGDQLQRRDPVSGRCSPNGFFFCHEIWTCCDAMPDRRCAASTPPIRGCRRCWPTISDRPAASATDDRGLRPAARRGAGSTPTRCGPQAMTVDYARIRFADARLCQLASLGGVRQRDRRQNRSLRCVPISAAR